jgi:hypothetical protein
LGTNQILQQAPTCLFQVDHTRVRTYNRALIS